MAKIKIEGCIGCGACTGICPEVFDLNDEGLAYNILGEDEEIPEDLMSGVDEAIESCPAQAIKK